MKRNNIATILFGVAVATLTSCGDVADEITSTLFGRNFSPIDFEAKNIGEENASLSWKASSGATSYVLEVFADDSLAFEGEADYSYEIENTKMDLEQLTFDTRYSARVKAITAEDESRDSKWSELTFKTSPKQFMSSIRENDIADRSVIIRWHLDEGYDVSTIVIGNVTHVITEEEKAAECATVEGLTPETAYTAYLYYNDKQLGSRNFTTIADLAGATLVHEGDDLKGMLENATSGEVFALFGGNYTISAGEEGTATAGSAKISTNITIKGVYPTNQPVINGRFEINDGAALSISQVVLDGTGTSGDQCFNYKTADATYGALDIQNTEIRNYSKGTLYVNVKSSIESVTFNNCLIHDIKCSGGDMFDCRAGLIKSFTLSNSTIYNSAADRDFIRMDDASGNFAGAAGPIVTVDHCTMHNVGTADAARQLMYVRFVGNKVTFTNNIVSGFKNKRGFTNQVNTDNMPTLSNNFYYNCVNLVKAGANADANIKWFDENGTELSADPFAGATNANFTLNPDDAPARSGAGDPRWR